MKKQIIILFTLPFSLFVHAQIIPFSMINKGNKFGTIDLRLNPYGTLSTWEGNSFYLLGRFDINTSSIPNIEVGFLYLPNSDSRILNIENAIKISFSDVYQVYRDAFISNLNFNTEYKIRAYAKTRLNQIAYSGIQTITMDFNYCLTDIGYCLNGGICESKWGGNKLCRCPDDFIGTRCEQFVPPGEDELQSSNIYSFGSKTLIGSEYSEKINFDSKNIQNGNNSSSIWYKQN